MVHCYLKLNLSLFLAAINMHLFIYLFIFTELIYKKQAPLEMENKKTILSCAPIQVSLLCIYIYLFSFISLESQTQRFFSFANMQRNGD